ncbi:MBL fold metallo-hydrolase [Rhodobacteraceae bacterium CCMM004]|nr:MBL fold metallo-hydrolase [Rhodobacteraceae bacterium CCMM004]
MRVTRRTLLATAAASVAAGLVPRRLVAEMALGDGTLTTVSDGHLVLPGDFLFAPMPQDALMPLLAELDVSRDTLEPPCNVTLWRDAEATVLFDCGAGGEFMPSAGRLLENLDAVGVAPEDVTHIVFTHAHPDHIWGLLDDFGDPAFPDAQLLMGATEHAYWTDPATVDTIGEARAAFAVGAARRLEMVADRVALFNDGDEVLPGIAAVASFGHTPGHMAFSLARGGTGAMVVGDAIGNGHVAFARPGWLSGADQDPEAAAETRQALLSQLADSGTPLVGFHLPGGGIGRAVPADGGYRFEVAS